MSGFNEDRPIGSVKNNYTPSYYSDHSFSLNM